MKKSKCYISDIHDPFFNLATEDWIFNDMDPSNNILFLWQNEKSVIIGRNQNPWAECNLRKIESNKVHLVRRQSGGGAVFQDLGNSIFTFMSSKEDYDKKRNFQIIINTLNKFGIKAEKSGRNDILVNGRKISGSAFKEKSDRAFHHGTLMIDVDLSELSQYLTPSQKKLMSKGTKSVRSRVANLKEFHKEITHESLTKAIIDEFFKTYNSEKDIEILNHESLSKIPELKKYYEFLKSHDWVLGETPKFKNNLNERFEWGIIDLNLNVENGRIIGCKIFSDCLDTKLINKLEKSIQKIRYDRSSIINSLNKLKFENPNNSKEIEQFSSWFVKKL